MVRREDNIKKIEIADSKLKISTQMSSGKPILNTSAAVEFLIKFMRNPAINQNMIDVVHKTFNANECNLSVEEAKIFLEALAAVLAETKAKNKKNVKKTSEKDWVKWPLENHGKNDQDKPNPAPIFIARLSLLGFNMYGLNMPTAVIAKVLAALNEVEFVAEKKHLAPPNSVISMDKIGETGIYTTKSWADVPVEVKKPTAEPKEILQPPPGLVLVKGENTVMISVSRGGYLGSGKSNAAKANAAIEKGKIVSLNGERLRTKTPIFKYVQDLPNSIIVNGENGFAAFLMPKSDDILRFGNIVIHVYPGEKKILAGISDGDLFEKSDIVEI